MVVMGDGANGWMLLRVVQVLWDDWHPLQKRTEKSRVAGNIAPSDDTMTEMLSTTWFESFARGSRAIPRCAQMVVKK